MTSRRNRGGRDLEAFKFLHLLVPEPLHPHLPVVRLSHLSLNLLIYFKNKFIYLFLFLAVLGLRSCEQAFSSCGEWGLLFVAVCGLLVVVSSLVAEHGL